ncbi:hypothetical protein SY83_10420 [Paenibacillus swuensis]|uniref:HTH araC/xylS-type domain-containing protein n=1 Tax=Paenibacillus swuensis TaxID=1178515 RepID=A0A172THS5_9BACL|nr:AraC family transcriptional regulator [Paenibacillus swuensis]ANE46615.1 hypothetical protein SY83_10420 [Paenibacillus swuensis]
MRFAEYTDMQTFPNVTSDLYLYGMHVSRTTRGRVCDRHLHHRMIEVNLVLEGRQTAIVGNTRLVQHAGDLVIIPPMKAHEFRVEHGESMTCFVMHIQNADHSVIRALRETGECLFPIGHLMHEKLHSSVLSMMSHLQAGASTPRILKSCCEILVGMEEYFLPEAGVASVPAEPALADRIAKAIEHLISASEEPNAPSLLTGWLEQIAEDLGVTRRHCYRVFQQTYGMSPREYLSLIRQQEAMHMLVNQRDSMELIAHRIGFENVQSFIRQFTKWTGTTPGKFRKQQSGALNYLTPLELDPGPNQV